MQRYIISFLLLGILSFCCLSGSKKDSKPKSSTITIKIKGKSAKVLAEKIQAYLKGENMLEDGSITIVTKSTEDASENSNSTIEQEKFSTHQTPTAEVPQASFEVDQEVIDSIKDWCWLSLEKLIALKEIGTNPEDYENFKEEIVQDLGIYKDLYNKNASVMDLFKDLNDYIAKN